MQVVLCGELRAQPVRQKMRHSGPDFSLPHAGTPYVPGPSGPGALLPDRGYASGDVSPPLRPSSAPCTSNLVWLSPGEQVSEMTVWTRLMHGLPEWDDMRRSTDQRHFPACTHGSLSAEARCASRHRDPRIWGSHNMKPIGVQHGCGPTNIPHGELRIHVLA